jgi:hypothetical protein
MKNFYYCCEVNVEHPSVADKPGPDLRAVTYISRTFMDTNSVVRSIEKDIIARLDKFIKGGRIPVRVTETNPLHLCTQEQIEEKTKAEPEYADYLSTWDHDLVNRMTITDEDIDNPDEQQIEVGYQDMPPRDYMLRYYIREYEDGIDVPSGTFFVQNESVH